MRALKRRGRLALPSARRHTSRAPLPRAGAAAHACCATRPRSPAGGSVLTARGSPPGSADERAGPACARAGRASRLRRLRGYVLRNRGYYASGSRPRSATPPASSPCRSWSAGRWRRSPTGSARRRSRAARSGSRRDAGCAPCSAYFSRTLVFNAAREIEYELRNDLFAHLQRLPQSFYFRWRTGDIMSRCVNDLTRCGCCSAPAC